MPDKGGIEIMPVIPPAKTKDPLFPPMPPIFQEQKKPPVPGPDTHSTSVEDKIKAEEKKIAEQLQNAIGLDEKSAKEIAAKPEIHQSAPQKSLLEKIPSPAKVGLFASIAILLTNLWKGIQSLWKKPDEGGGMQPLAA